MKRHLLVLTTIALVITANFFFKKHSREISAAAREAETGIASWDRARVEAGMTVSDAAFRRADEALDAGDLPTSFLAYQTARGTLLHYVKHYPDKKVSGNDTLQNWYSAREYRYLARIQSAFPRALDQLAGGAVSYDEIQQLTRDFENIGQLELKHSLNREYPRIAAERSRQAHNWIRIQLPEEESLYGDVLLKAVRNRWQPAGGLKLVVGRAMTPAEARATLKTFLIRVNVNGDGDAGPTLEEPAAPRPAESIELQLSLMGSPHLRTTWDQPMKFSARVAPPTAAGDGEPGAEVGRATGELGRQLALELRNIPTFQLFPGVEPVELRLDKGNKLDLGSAWAMSYLDRTRFENQIKPFFMRNAAVDQPALATLVIGLQLDPYLPWLMQTLPQLPDASQTECVSRLGTTPWFGNYEPLIQMLPHRTGLALTALQQQTSDPEVKSAILKQTLPTSTNRNQAAQFVVRELPQEEVRSLAHAWFKDPDPGFVEAVFIAVRTQYPAIATELTLLHFDNVSADLQTRMLNQFEFTAEHQSEKAFALLRRAATESSNPYRKKHAIESLKSYVDTTQGWDILHDLVNSGAIMHEKSDVETRLVYSAWKAHPGSAETYLLNLLQTREQSLWPHVIDQLLAGPQSKNVTLKELNKLVAAHSADQSLLAHVIGTIRKYAQRDRGWDLTEHQTDLKSLLTLGIGHPSPKTRQSAYSVMQRAAEEGFSSYADLLRRLIITEPDAAIRREFAIRLGLNLG